MIRVCVIGISGYGGIHYDLLTTEQAAGSIEIVGATVINQAEEREKCDHLKSIGCSLYEDYTVMLKELSGKCDLCCIPTGTPLHRMMTVDALDAGMNVFVEKPAAGSVEDVQAMMDAEARSGCTVMVGYQQLFDPVALELKRAILDQRIGDVQGIKCKVSWPRNSSYYARNTWAGMLKVGDTWVRDSPMNNAVAHDLMMMLYLAGPSLMEAATPVSVSCELYRANEIESADTLCLRVETNTGIPLLFFATHAGEENFSPEMKVTGAEGHLEWSHREAAIVTSTEGRVELEKLFDELRFVMIKDVIRRVEEGTPVISTLDVAIKQTLVIEGCHLVSEITTVPHHEVVVEDGHTLQVIPELVDIIVDAYENEALFHERGVSWATPANTYLF